VLLGAGCSSWDLLSPSGIASLWFAKMISDAKCLRISDIHIDVRAWEGIACSIVIRSFLRPEEIFGRHSQGQNGVDIVDRHPGAPSSKA